MKVLNEINTLLFLFKNGTGLNVVIYYLKDWVLTCTLVSLLFSYYSIITIVMIIVIMIIMFPVVNKVVYDDDLW